MQRDEMRNGLKMRTPPACGGSSLVGKIVFWAEKIDDWGEKSDRSQSAEIAAGGGKSGLGSGNGANNGRLGDVDTLFS
jgi:hypothetical protein